MSCLPPSSKVTVPAGVPVPEDTTATVAESLTVSPDTNAPVAVVEYVRLVVVGTGLTTSVMPLLPAAKLVLPE